MRQNSTYIHFLFFLLNQHRSGHYLSHKDLDDLELLLKGGDVGRRCSLEWF